MKLQPAKPGESASSTKLLVCHETPVTKLPVTKLPSATRIEMQSIYEDKGILDVPFK
jgi:hypothetical protein